jgi:hypothetical protein
MDVPTVSQIACHLTNENHFLVSYNMDIAYGHADLLPDSLPSDK